MSDEARPSLSRRAFLSATAGAGAAVVAGSVGGGALAAATVLGPRPGVTVDPAAVLPRLVPFEGEHQAGIDRPVPAQGAAIFAAFDVLARGP